MKKIFLAVLFVLLSLAAGAIALAYMALSNFDKSDWRVAVPLGKFGQAQVKVVPALRLATTSWGKFLLNGRQWQFRSATIRIASHNGALIVLCRPCRLHLSEWSEQPLAFSEVALTLNRQENQLSGQVSVTANSITKRVFFTGEVRDQGVSINWSLPSSEISTLLELLDLPEMKTARVYGTLAANGRLTLPQGKWSVTPQLEGFEVYGLGTERLRYGAFSYMCRDERNRNRLRRSGDRQPGWIRLSAIGQWLPRSVIATEDARFYEHPGYDLNELLLLLSNPDRSFRQGSSTLTQQLAKNLYTGANRNLQRKVRELLYTVEMERTLGKQRILTLYLNTVDWGPGLCGATDASTAYFAAAPRQLKPVQAAWLAGILRNPHQAYEQEFVMGKAENRRLKWVMKQLPQTARQPSQNKLVFANMNINE